MPYKDNMLARINQRERTRRWRENHPEDVKRAQQSRYWSNPERNRLKSRKYYWANRTKALEAAKTRNQLRLYGLTPDELDSLDKVCAICEAKSGNSKGHRLHVDHCKDTGIVRGKLCSSCNRALGGFKHDPELLRRAADYLERKG